MNEINAQLPVGLLAQFSGRELHQYIAAIIRISSKLDLFLVFFSHLRKLRIIYNLDEKRSTPKFLTSLSVYYNAQTFCPSGFFSVQKGYKNSKPVSLWIILIPDTHFRNEL